MYAIKFCGEGMTLNKCRVRWTAYWSERWGHAAELENFLQPFAFSGFAKIGLETLAAAEGRDSYQCSVHG